MEDIPNKTKDVLGVIVDVNLHTTAQGNYLEIIVEDYPYPVNYKGQYHYRSGSTKQELKSATVRKGFAKELNQINTLFTKSLTYDNGMEMAEHKQFTNHTNMPVYFAHPYSSWERGTNENTNGLIRRFSPKGTDFKKVSEKQLKVVQKKLNNRPRKILRYRTPNEVFQSELLNHKMKKYDDDLTAC